mmetsp:Transcript_20051/g.43195  ORF Transcript_20051/g.43195 Transcript_20051/m.43195 type:complete len:202 (+) Transcript_20051:570-1175(+)
MMAMTISSTLCTNVFLHYNGVLLLLRDYKRRVMRPSKRSPHITFINTLHIIYILVKMPPICHHMSSERSPGNLIQVSVLHNQLLNPILKLGYPPCLQLIHLHIRTIKIPHELHFLRLRTKKQQRLVARSMKDLGIRHSIDILRWIHRRIVLNNVIHIWRNIKFSHGNIRCKQYPRVTIQKPIMSIHHIHIFHRFVHLMNWK